MVTKTPNKEVHQLQVNGTPAQSVPKFSTAVNINVLQRSPNFFVLTFAYSDNPEADVPFTLIERIMVEREHLKKMIDAFNQALKATESQLNNEDINDKTN